MKSYQIYKSELKDGYITTCCTIDVYSDSVNDEPIESRMLTKRLESGRISRKVVKLEKAEIIKEGKHRVTISEEQAKRLMAQFPRLHFVREVSLLQHSKDLRSGAWRRYCK